MRWLVSFLVLAGLFGAVSALSLTVLDPVFKEVTASSTLDLGTAGPGQKIVVIAQRPSGDLSKNAAKPGEALWDRILIERLPDGWTAEASKLYEEPFQAFVSIAPDAADGEYTFYVRAMDEYDGLPSLSFPAKLRVSRNVFSASLTQSRLSVGVEQPAVYFLQLQNTGSASDVFDVAINGLPASWSEPRRVFVPHNSVVNLAFPVTPEEANQYVFSFHAQSLSSPRVFSDANAELVAETTLLNDLRASANGVVLFPSPVQAVYSLLAFLARAFS
ncbi:hypothetical protein HY572_03870 [Candidatus Micrarchaeota archaeon]|nr:hypothetical protein [Candidatus Micrarchaeota archaeon]